MKWRYKGKITDRVYVCVCVCVGGGGGGGGGGIVLGLGNKKVTKYMKKSMADI